MRRVVIEVVAALVPHPTQSNRYLVACRSAGETRGGKWEFPGGKIRAEESHEQALARELREELAVASDIGPLYLLTFHQYEDIGIRLWTYLTTIHGNPTAGPGHSTLAWMLPDEMVSADFSAADLPVIRALRAGMGEIGRAEIFD